MTETTSYDEKAPASAGAFFAALPELVSGGGSDIPSNERRRDTVTTMLHFSPTLGAFTRCRAIDRPGQGVSLCPNFTEGSDGSNHIEGMAGIAAMGGGQIHRNGRLTTVTPNTDGTFTAKTGKLARVYTAEGKLLSLEERNRIGWTAQERANAENAAIKALIEEGAFDPNQASRLSGIASLDELRRMSQIQWANMSEYDKAELIQKAFEDTAKRYGVGKFTYSEDGVFQPMRVTGQTTFYVDKDREPVVAFSKSLTTSLSNTTATDAIAREIAHLIEGRVAGHGPGWQRRVRELRKEMGLDIHGNPLDEPHTRSLFEQEQAKLYARNLPFTAKCASGKHEFYRADLEKARGYCGDCYRESKNPNVTLSWEKNADAGKWVMTKNGLEKLDKVPEAPKKARGRKVEDWRKLSAIETDADLKAAINKMSGKLAKVLAATYYVTRHYPEKSRKSPIVNEPDFMWPDVIMSGYTLTDKDLARIDNYLATAPDDPEEHKFGSLKNEIRDALKSYAPDPERFAFVRSLHEKFMSTAEAA